MVMVIVEKQIVQRTPVSKIASHFADLPCRNSINRQTRSPRLPSTPHSRSFVAQSRISEGQPVFKARSFADQMMFKLCELMFAPAVRCAVPRVSLCDIDCFAREGNRVEVLSRDHAMHAMATAARAARARAARAFVPLNPQSSQCRRKMVGIRDQWFARGDGVFDACVNARCRLWGA
jgi:hypothetical protein